LRQAIQDGSSPVVGTHALIQESVSFHVGPRIIEYSTGLESCSAQVARGLNPDVLVMTATPIPRSLAMTVYGDRRFDDRFVAARPHSAVTKILWTMPRIVEVKQLLAREMRAGRQIYVVYPLVEESEKMDLRDATRRYEYLRDQVFPKFSVGLLHGSMKPEEKDEVMRRFVAGEIQILVSTTVIEVGVDVPNASVMVIEHSERFGLSQLHQLRGRGLALNKASVCYWLRTSRPRWRGNVWESWKRRTMVSGSRKKI
jgi:ATP-dependent DNA helicase RecG